LTTDGVDDEFEKVADNVRSGHEAAHAGAALHQELQQRGPEIFLFFYYLLSTHTHFHVFLCGNEFFKIKNH
jgi:hypothetical protein